MKNWRNCEDMWIQLYRKDLAILATQTNNHIESFNRVIKRRIRANMHLSETIKELNEMLDEYVHKQAKYLYKNLKSSTSTFINQNIILQCSLNTFLLKVLFELFEN